MAKCNNCFHNQVCDFACKRCDGANCIFFVDCSRLVEFPCAIGDTIFRVAEFLCKTEPVEYRVSGLSVKKDKTIKIKLSDNIGVFEITKADIGKSFFLTYEDAKAELNRRMNDGKM